MSPVTPVGLFLMAECCRVLQMCLIQPGLPYCLTVPSSSAFDFYRIIQEKKLLLAVDDIRSVPSPVAQRQFIHADQQFAIRLFVPYLQ